MDINGIVIDVDMNVDSYLKSASQLRGEIDKLKQANKLLTDSVKDGSLSYEDASKEIEKNKASIANLEKQYKSFQKSAQGLTSSNIEMDGSLNEMRRNLTTLQDTWASLSKEQRENSEVGGKLLQDIKKLDAEVKNAEGAMGDFRRNVGNYPSAIKGLIPHFDELEKVFGKIGVTADTTAKEFKGAFSNGIKTAINQVVTFGKTLLTTPLGWMVGAIALVVGALKKLSDAFKKNDDAGTAMQRLFANLQPLISLIGKAFDGLATILGKVANAISNVIELFSDSAKSAQDYVLSVDALEDKEREYAENSAKRNRDIAELRDKATQKDKYSAEERAKYLEQAIAMESQNLKEEQDIAKDRLRLLEQEAEQNNDTSDEMKKRTTDARSAMYKAEENYYTGTRRLQTELQSARKEHTDDEKKAQDERIKNAEEYKKKREQIAKDVASLEQQIEDIYVSMITDATQREIEQLTIASEREVNELRKRKARNTKEQDAINQLITAKETKLQNDIQAVKDRAVEELTRKKEEELNADYEREQRRLQILLDASTKGTQQYFELRRQAMERQREQELADATLTEEEKIAIQTKYLQMFSDLQLEQNQAETSKKIEAMQLEYEAKVAELDAENASDYEREQANLQQLNEMRDALRVEDFASAEEYTNARNKLNSKIADSERKLIAIQAQQTASVLGSLNTIVGAFSDVMGDFAEDNESFASFQKALALFQIGVDTAKAISAGTAQAMSVPFPANIAAIATTTATVIANIASAISTLKKQKEPKFASGGIVGGTSYSGDNVSARVNSGEMILTRQQQSQLFDIANSKQSPLGMDYGMMASAMRDAVESMPSPIMDYAEYTNFKQNVSTYKEFSRI